MPSLFVCPSPVLGSGILPQLSRFPVRLRFRSETWISNFINHCLFPRPRPLHWPFALFDLCNYPPSVTALWPSFVVQVLGLRDPNLYTLRQGFLMAGSPNQLLRPGKSTSVRPDGVAVYHRPQWAPAYFLKGCDRRCGTKSVQTRRVI